VMGAGGGGGFPLGPGAFVVGAFGHGGCAWAEGIARG